MAARGSRTVDQWSPWVNTWTGLSLPGVGAALVGWGPGAVLALAAISAAMAAFVLAALDLHDDAAEEPCTAIVRTWGSRVMMCAMALAVSTLAWLALVPGIGLLLALAAVATLPPAVALVRRTFVQTTASVPDSPRARVGDPLDTLDALTARRVSQQLDEAARAMSDAELCRAWRRSWWSLKDAGTTTERLAVVLQRQSFLDAFDARDKRSIQRWIAPSTQARSGAQDFLTGAFDQEHDERDT